MGFLAAAPQVTTGKKQTANMAAQTGSPLFYWCVPCAVLLTHPHSTPTERFLVCFLVRREPITAAVTSAGGAVAV